MRPPSRSRNRITRALEADNTLVNGLILQRLFSNLVRTNDYGLPVLGLWNGDGQVPPSHMGRSFAGDHSHYLTTESVTFDPLHFEAGQRHVTEHGYGSTQSARLLLLIHPDDLIASKLTSWRAGVTFDPTRLLRSISSPAATPLLALRMKSLWGPRRRRNTTGLRSRARMGNAW